MSINPVSPTAVGVSSASGATAPGKAPMSGQNGIDKKSALFQFMLNQLLNPPNVLTDAGGSGDDEDDGSSLAVKASGFPAL